jgi:hypothetical protein
LAAIGQRSGIVRLQRDRLLVVGDCLVELQLMQMRAAAVAIGPGEVPAGQRAGFDHPRAGRDQRRGIALLLAGDLVRTRRFCRARRQ